MSDLTFSNGTEFEIFQANNCIRDGDGSACHHDINEDCEVLAALIVDNHHPDVKRGADGHTRCKRRVSIDTVARRDREFENRVAARLEMAVNEQAHFGGLFPAEEASND